MPFDAPTPREAGQQQKSSRKPLPEKGVGVTSATRFLHVKRFRFNRVKSMLVIAGVILVIAFVAVCIFVYELM